MLCCGHAHSCSFNYKQRTKEPAIGLVGCNIVRGQTRTSWCLNRKKMIFGDDFYADWRPFPRTMHVALANTVQHGWSLLPVIGVVLTDRVVRIANALRGSLRSLIHGQNKRKPWQFSISSDFILPFLSMFGKRRSSWPDWRSCNPRLLAPKTYLQQALHTIGTFPTQFRWMVCQARRTVSFKILLPALDCFQLSLSSVFLSHWLTGALGQCCRFCQVEPL